MTVMGIDPGLGASGWAVVTGEGETLTLVAFGAIRTDPAAQLADRLVAICDGIRQIVSVHSPDEVAIEDVFLAKDARAAFALGQARGAAIVGAAQGGCRAHSYTALQVKQSVTGHGHASKDQVGFMVRRLLNLAEPLRPADCADAAAIALCHLQRSRCAMAIAGVTP